MIGFYFDPTYLLMLPALLFGIWAQINVNSTFDRYNQVKCGNGMTAADAARRVLDANGVTGVVIECIPGRLTDHFDPKSNVIRLSESVYSSTSMGAIGVACHEAGHAVQYAENYAPIRVRSAIVPIANFGSYAFWPLFFIGLLFNMYWLAMVGIALYSLVALFQLVTLPVEFNASRRAMEAIRSSGYFSSEESKGAGKVLRAAALTYVAALATALLTVLRLLLIVGRNRRD